MISQEVVVNNPRGIHVRPSGVIAQKFQHYSGRIELSRRDGRSVSAKSTLSILSLGLGPGEIVKVMVDGEDEESICRQVCSYLGGIFDYSHEDVRLAESR